MNIILAFDHSSTTIFVPDGYVSDVEHLRACFFDWLYDNPQYMTCDEKGHAVCAYDAMAFLAYINQVILRASNEKAYVIPRYKRAVNSIVWNSDIENPSYSLVQLPSASAPYIAGQGRVYTRG